MSVAQTPPAPFEAEPLADGGVMGPVRHPVNVSREAVGSIHDDATAQTLGFRGGTVAANIHMEQFPPLFAARFGQPWTAPGGLSLYFLQPTTDGEPVRAAMGPLNETQGGDWAEAWIETPEGARVCEGMAWRGAAPEPTTLRARLAQARPAQDLRILAASKIGDKVANVPARIDSATALVRVKGITEPSEAYVNRDANGRYLAAPAVVIDALRAVETPLFKSQGEFVGMFGAIELEHLAGPVMLDTDYLVDGEVIGLGESPKTEIAWYESRLRSAAGGPVLARLLMMTRVLKGSSPLWT